MIRFLISLYRGPSSQPGDPAAWLGTQAAHALIVGGGGMLAFWWLDWWAVATVAGFYAGWEWFQWIAGGSALDGLTDWLFVVSGAVLAWAGLAGERVVFAMALTALVAAGVGGVWRRL